MGWLDDIPTDAGPMQFEHGETVYRLRPKQVFDPRSNTYILGDWADPEVVEIPGAFIAQSSTSGTADATRTQALESKSLYCAPDSDVRKGDRIRQGPEGAPVFPVDGIPASDVNPFTGWQPVREVPLARAVG